MDYDKIGLTYAAAIKAAEDMVARHERTLAAMLQTRRAHPTYGITKAMLREQLAYLDSAGHMVDILLGGHGASVAVSAMTQCERLGIDYRALRRRVEEA